jgi:hypothetical protein
MSLFLAAALLFSFGCSDDDPAPMPPEEESIIDIASGNTNFSTLLQL